MKNYEPNTFPTPPHFARMERMKERYRNALLSVGKSPDYHIFDLSTGFLEHLKDTRAKRYLFSLRSFFVGLDQEQQRIFVMEILERGRHYPFWYLEEYTRREYAQKLMALVAEVPPCLTC